MKILNICKFDFAGCAWDLTRALRRHTAHDARHVTMSKHEWQFGSDIVTTDGEKLRKWLEWADVVACWGNFRTLDTAGVSGLSNLIAISVGDEYPYHLEAYRERCVKYGVKKRLHGSILYSQLADDWLPIAVPVDEYGTLKKERGAKPVICQAPSNQRRKSTEEVIDLLGRREDVDLLVINKVKHCECLEAMAHADILVDHFPGIQVGEYIELGGCGKTSLEAWALGIPVIAYAEEPKRAAYLETVGYLPYYESRLENLPAAVDALLDERMYNEYSEKGCQYVKTFHDDPVVAQRFMNVCQELAH